MKTALGQLTPQEIEAFLRKIRDLGGNDIEEILSTFRTIRIHSDLLNLILQKGEGTLKDIYLVLQYALKDYRRFCELFFILQEGTGVFDEKLFLAIWETELPGPTINSLQKADLFFLGEVVQKTEKQLLASRGVGKAALKNIKEMLTKLNLSLGMQLDNFPEREKLESLRKKRRGF